MTPTVSSMHFNCSVFVCDIVWLQDKQVSCMDACAVEYAGQVPKLKADCQAGLKKLGG